MPGADGMSAKFMKNAFVGWTFTAGLYYPPDFDSSKLLPMKVLRPKGEKKETALNIRMMFPFTMICDACGEYNYTGTKFTSKCEEIKGESYLGIKVFRFYGRCRHCWAEFTFKTDPKNSDYTMESGGKRTYEAWKDADMMESQMKQEKEEAKNDQMKALEQKTIDVQAEMQRLDDLDSIRTLNKRLGNRDQSVEAALEFLFKQKEKEEEEKADEPLSAGEAKELEGFKAAQEDEKRKRMDEQCEEKEDTAVGGSSSSSAGASGSASGSSSAKASSDSALAGAGIAAAVAERVAASSAARSAVGAKFTVVKRKAPDDAAAGESASKKTCAEAGSNAGGATPSSVGGAAASSVSTGIGLGAYDSDSS